MFFWITASFGNRDVLSNNKSYFGLQLVMNYYHVTWNHYYYLKIYFVQLFTLELSFKKIKIKEKKIIFFIQSLH